MAVPLGYPIASTTTTRFRCKPALRSRLGVLTLMQSWSSA
jgi:hypothetical protein